MLLFEVEYIYSSQIMVLETLRDTIQLTPVCSYQRHDLKVSASLKAHSSDFIQNDLKRFLISWVLHGKSTVPGAMICLQWICLASINNVDMLTLQQSIKVGYFFQYGIQKWVTCLTSIAAMRLKLSQLVKTFESSVQNCCQHSFGFPTFL